MSVIIKKIDSLEILTAENIPASHAFTTRLGGVSEGYLSSLNLGAHRGDDLQNVIENYGILGSALGFSIPQMVLTNQVHEDTVRVVTKSDAKNSISNRDYPECDALITNDPGTALMVFSADCTPILFHDPVTGAVGAAHAGWRGTALGIAGKVAKTMAEHFGSDPRDIRAAIGPNIGSCCFETDADVPDAMIAAFGSEANAYITPKNGKYFVDLKGLNALSLRRAGVENIAISTHCTACRPDLFWSHRVTKGHRGSQGAVIVCRKER